MANYPGYPYDPLSSYVQFHYKLRTNFADSGPNAFAAATPTLVTDFIDPSFRWDDGTAGGLNIPTGQGGASVPTAAIPDSGTGDFTLDVVINGPLDGLYVNDIFFMGATSGSPHSLIFIELDEFFNTALCRVFHQISPGDTVSASVSSLGTLSDNTDYYFSVCKNGDWLLFYINGVLQGKSAITAGTDFDFTAGNAPKCIIGYDDEAGVFNGHIAEVRFTNAARYDGSDFVVPPLDDASAPDGSANSNDSTDTLKLRAWGFPLDGHDFYVLRCGQQGTLVLDLTTGQWSKWETSGYSSSWNAMLGLYWNDKVVAADQSDPIIWRLNDGGALDNGALDITRTVTGIYPLSGRDYVPCNNVMLEASVGDPTAANPTVTLSFSDDDGETFTSAGAITLTGGSAGDYSQKLWWSSLGNMTAPGRIFRIVDVGGLVRIDNAQMEIG